jgi:hypothetical protein
VQTRIVRPDIRKPDAYQINLGETMLLWLEDGILHKMHALHRNIDAHGECDLTNESGCKVREAWLIQNYGALDAAIKAGFRVTDCAEDLAFLYSEVGHLMDTLNQSRWLRNNPGGRCFHDLTDAEAKLRDIQGEVNHRVKSAASDTGLMVKLDEEQLAKLDAQDAAAVNESLLGLQSSSTPPAAQPVKK